MSMLENYIGQNDNNRTTRSYLGFLKGHCDIIITSIATTTTFLGDWKNLDNLWAVRFLDEGKDLPDLKDKVISERSRYTKTLKIFWQEIIKEYRKTSKKHNEKENLLPADSSHLQNVIELSDKDNVKKNIEIPIKDHFISTDLQNVIEISDKNNIKNHSISNSSHPKKNIKVPIKDNSISIKNYSIFTKDHSKNSQLINFCYDILQELDIKSNIHPFYKYDEKIIKNPIDLFTIISKLENNQYANIEEFEIDIRLIFRNCYKYNDIGSEMHTLGEELESAFNKIWTEKIIFQVKQKEKLKRVRDNDTDTDSSSVKQKEKLKRVRDNDTDTDSSSVKQKEKLKRVRDNDTDTDSSSELVTKQIRILEQNKDRLVYKQVVNDALLIASAYENLVTDNIMPFIELLKTFLSTRSQISLSSAGEPVLQAIVENLLPLKYRIPELSLVMDSTKLKGFGRFGYSDIFVLKGIGNNNISLELKYISLIGLIKNQKKKFNTNDLENLDKIIEKEDEKILLKRSYEYWSKEHNENKQITIEEVLNNGVNQLKSYMNIISKGKSIDYYSSGIFDKRIKITKSNPNKLKGNPNKLKGFVILVIGFRRILWRSVEMTSNYSYEKI
ncbi:hypothetical protein RhiirA4_548448 [Rhizophagus irregularis]|uniref:Bromo domain-containing protein n=1 Tax=Rhizophagus irregularis TaxID=588596 RepID=A0A2I1H7M6_9GLOM|nr:hypothetical protein RhiirA4_548448 [Rhizophagus irregularis]